jgi:polar amino acid transport system substrate-binding protein
MTFGFFPAMLPPVFLLGEGKSRMKHAFFTIIIGLIGFIHPATADKIETLVISSPAIPPVSGTYPEPGYLKNIIVEAGKRIDVKISFRHMPAVRSLVASDSGTTQGELHRVEGLEKLYPNLIRVPEPVVIDQFVGFAATPDMVIKDWRQTGDLQISYPRGWTLYAQAFGEDNSHHMGNSGVPLFKMVEHGRIDIAMHTLDKGTYIAAKNDIHVYPVKPAFAIKPMYMYLHHSKAHLVDRLAQSIREVKQDGTYESIKRDVLFHHGLINDAYFAKGEMGGFTQ